MLALQEELSATENKIAFARQAYNDSVMVYNTQREVFPTSIIAGMFNFQEAHLFEVEQPHGAGSTQGFVHVRCSPHAPREEELRAEFAPEIHLTRSVTSTLLSVEGLAIDGDRFLRPAGSRSPPDDAAAGSVRFVGGGHHRGDLSGGGRRVDRRRVDRSPSCGLRPSGTLIGSRPSRPVAARAVPGHRGWERCWWSALGSLYKIAELSAGGETVALMLGGRADRSANHRSGRTAAVERGRGDGPGLGHSRAAGLRAG